ncbi:MAG: hypothetical protein U0835_07660 [Isosphaeraceae bacterium]
MKQRNGFRGTSLESLEDRKLLTGANGMVSLARLHQRMAQVAAFSSPGRLAQLARANAAIPQGAISTSATTQVGAAPLRQPTALTVLPRASTRLANAAIGVPAPTTSNTVSVSLQPATRGLLPSNLGALVPGGYGRLRAGSYPSQSGVLSPDALKTTVISANAFPTATPAPIAPATDTATAKLPASAATADASLVAVQSPVMPMPVTAPMGLDGLTSRRPRSTR